MCNKIKLNQVIKEVVNWAEINLVRKLKYFNLQREEITKFVFDEDDNNRIYYNLHRAITELKNIKESSTIDILKTALSEFSWRLVLTSYTKDGVKSETEAQLESWNTLPFLERLGCLADELKHELCK